MESFAIVHNVAIFLLTCTVTTYIANHHVNDFIITPLVPTVAMMIMQELSLCNKVAV